MSRRLVVVPYCSGSSSPGNMDLSLTTLPEVNAIWTYDISVNIHQRAKCNIPERLRTFSNTAVKAENCYIFRYIFFTWNVSTIPWHTPTQHLAPASCCCRLAVRAKASGIPDLGEERHARWGWRSISPGYGAFTGCKLRRRSVDTQSSWNRAEYGVAGSRHGVVSLTRG